MEIAARLHTGYQNLEKKDLNVGTVFFLYRKVTGRKNSEADGLLSSSVRVLGVSLLLKRVTACLQLFISLRLHVISISSSIHAGASGHGENRNDPYFTVKLNHFIL